MTPRKKPPTQKSCIDSPLGFRVWAHAPAYLEDANPWKCIAAFRYLMEALDYIADAQDKGVDVVFQTSADCRHIMHTDRRVVYRESA